MIDMPAFVKHEADWSKARKAADKKGLKGEKYWKYTTAIYKKIHPEDFAKEAAQLIKSLDINPVNNESVVNTFPLKMHKNLQYTDPSGGSNINKGL